MICIQKLHKVFYLQNRITKLCLIFFSLKIKSIDTMYYLKKYRYIFIDIHSCNYYSKYIFKKLLFKFAFWYQVINQYILNIRLYLYLNKYAILNKIKSIFLQRSS